MLFFDGDESNFPRFKPIPPQATGEFDHLSHINSVMKTDLPRSSRACSTMRGYEVMKMGLAASFSQKVLTISSSQEGLVVFSWRKTVPIRSLTGPARRLDEILGLIFLRTRTIGYSISSSLPGEARPASVSVGSGLSDAINRFWISRVARCALVLEE